MMPGDRMLVYTIRAIGVLYLCILGVLVLPIFAYAACTGFKFFQLIPIGDVAKFCFGAPLAITILASPLCLLYGAIATKDDARRYARTADGHCFRCGYDLTGLAPDAVCPECGGRET